MQLWSSSSHPLLRTSPKLYQSFVASFGYSEAEGLAAALGGRYSEGGDDFLLLETSAACEADGQVALASHRAGLKRLGGGWGTFRIVPVESGRGCPYGFEFCTVTGFFVPATAFDYTNFVRLLRRQ